MTKGGVGGHTCTEHIEISMMLGEWEAAGNATGERQKKQNGCLDDMEMQERFTSGTCRPKYEKNRIAGTWMEQHKGGVRGQTWM
jgi:hypothetical protein